MPLFEYACQDCSVRFEVLVRNGESPSCPSCRSQHLDKQLSVFAAHGGATESPHVPAVAGPCGACGDPRGAGACSIE